MKILLVSDTHGKHALLKDLPEANIFIHAGDFMNSGRHIEEVISFNSWLDKVPVPKPFRLICGGNHDVMFDSSARGINIKDVSLAKKNLINGTYLKDQSITLHGIKFWFSPWTPEFLGWGFNATREQLKENWAKIPDDTEFLVTHGPPYGILDQIFKAGDGAVSSLNHHLGCEELYKKVKQLKNLKYHIFGHIHGGRGRVKNENGGPEFINASFLDERYQPHPGPGYYLLEI